MMDAPNDNDPADPAHLERLVEAREAEAARLRQERESLDAGNEAMRREVVDILGKCTRLRQELRHNRRINWLNWQEENDRRASEGVPPLPLPALFGTPSAQADLRPTPTREQGISERSNPMHLERCPFCDADVSEAHVLTLEGWAFMNCNCGARGPDVSSRACTEAEWRKAAGQGWNSRAANGNPYELPT